MHNTSNQSTATQSKGGCRCSHIKAISVHESHFPCMKRPREDDSPEDAAQFVVASEHSAQLSLLPARAAQPAEEIYRRAWDGKLYTYKEFLKHYGSTLGEVRWKNDQDEYTQWHEPANVTATDVELLRSPEQPASSLQDAAQQAYNVHCAAHANHTEYMGFLQHILNYVYDMWRSMNDPKRVKASLSGQWNRLTCLLEGITRAAAAHNSQCELNCTANKAVDTADIEKLNATSSLLFRRISTTGEKDDELIPLMDKLPRATVAKVTWAEVKRYFETTHGDDAHLNTGCVGEAEVELEKGQQQVNTIAKEAQRLLFVPNYAAE